MCDRVGGEQDLARRAEARALHPRQGDLRLRAEEADRLHFVTEQLDPHRAAHRGRRNVDDPAAHGELADVIHEVHALVAEVHQRACEVVAIERIADGHLAARGLHGIARDRLQHQRLHARDDDDRLAAGEAIEHGEALGNLLALGRDAIVERGGDRGVGQDLRRVVVAIAQERAEVLGDAAGALIVVGDDEHGASGHGEAGDQQC